MAIGHWLWLLIIGYGYLLLVMDIYIKAMMTMVIDYE